MTNIPNFNLDLPNIGGDDNNWGDILDTVLRDALDDYIGRLTGLTKTNLPAAGTAGRLARVTDDVRGLWMDQGSQWFSLSGQVVNVREFGAVGDGVTDDTAAIQAAIDAANAAGGGVGFAPPGTYNHTGLTLPAGVVLRGAGMTATALDFTPSTGDSITMSTDPTRAGVADMSFLSTGATTGWAITAASGAQRDVFVERVVIAQHLKGIKMSNILNVSLVGPIRINGKGKAVAGGVGLDFTGNGLTATSCYINNIETGGTINCQAAVFVRPILELCTTGLDLVAPATVIHPWVSATNTSDFRNRTGALLLGYGDGGLRITYDSAAAQDRTVIIPERLSNSLSPIKLGKLLITSAGKIQQTADLFELLEPEIRIAPDAAGVAKLSLHQFGSGERAYFDVLDSTGRATLYSAHGIDIRGNGATIPWTFFDRLIEGEERTTPSAPAANKGRIYFKDNGAGKTQLVVLFSSGAEQVIATQP